MINDPADNFSLNALLDQISDGQAIIKLEDGQKINWPASRLPAGLTPSTPLQLHLSAAGQNQPNQQQIAKQVLQEILNTEDEG